MNLTPRQWRLLNACVQREQHSTATIQNTTRALVRRGLVVRVKRQSRTLLAVTDEGRKEWFVQMRTRADTKALAPRT